jgi:putative ABC transport system ATP-binding protein
VRKLFPGPDRSTVLQWYLPELSLAAGETVMVSGPSGCGKTTLVNIVSGLLQADAGAVFVEGHNVEEMSTAEADVFRGNHLGLVFQSFQLLRPLTVLDNLLLGARYARRWHGAEARHRAEALLEQVGLTDRRHYRSAQLSIGEQQRVAVARALINEPPVVLADEPTASLDARNAGAVLDLLLGLCAQQGATLVVVSHNTSLAPHFSRMVDASGWMTTLTREAAHV